MSKLSKLILRDFKPQSKHSPKATQTRKKWNILNWKTCISRAPVVVDASRALFWCSCVWLLLRLPVSPGSPFRFRMPRAGPVLPKSDPESRPRSTNQNKTDLSPYSPKSVQRRITFLSSVWLYDAFSPGNIGLPPALSGGTSLRQTSWHHRMTFFDKKSRVQSPCLGSCPRGQTIHHAEGSTICKKWIQNKDDVNQQWR